MDYGALVGTVLGGLIAIGGGWWQARTSERRALTTRWDQERLDSVARFCQTAAALEGAHYRRARTDPADEALLKERRAIADQQLNQLYMDFARLRVLMPVVVQAGERVMTTERALRACADSFMPVRTDEWVSLRTDHREAIEALAAAVAGVLGTAK